MRFALLVLATLNLVGCSQDSPQRSPAAPSSSSSVPTAGPGYSAVVFAMVVGQGSGLCLDGATIQVVSGQSAGVSVPQTTPCDVWDADGGVWLKDLVPGVAMTLRATAAGRTPLEKTVVPSSGNQSAVVFELSPTP
jgi:hypothetical protein